MQTKELQIIPLDRLGELAYRRAFWEHAPLLIGKSDEPVFLGSSLPAIAIKRGCAGGAFWCAFDPSF
jgi:hypothetical protein